MNEPEHDGASRIYWLCAIAGPLLCPEWEALGLQDALQTERGLKQLRGGYVPSQSYAISELRSKLSEDLITLLEQLEAMRQNAPNRDCEYLRARMRQALVLGQDAHFLQLLHDYGGDNQSGWHPDRDRRFLWMELLGEELRDSQLVPEGAGRNELLYHILMLYSFAELPEGIALPIAPYSERDRLNLAIYAHRVGDTPLLEGLVHEQPAEDILRALWLHHRGEYKEAQPLFKHFVGMSAHGSMIISGRQQDCILPIAIQNAIAAKVGRSVSECWMVYAQLCIISYDEDLGLKQRAEEASQALAKLRQLRDAPPEKSTPRPSAEEHQEAIFWDIHLSERDDRIEKLETRLLPPAKEGTRVGRQLALGKLAAGQYHELCDADDARLLPYLVQGKWSYLQAWQLSHAGYAALAQHPRLRLIDERNGKRRALRLQVAASTGTDEDYQLRPQADGSFILSLPEEVATQAMDGDESMEGEGLHALLQFRAQQLILSLKGDDEAAHCLLADYPLLKQGEEIASFCWRYAELPLALEVLQSLKSSGIPLLWQGSKALHVQPAVAQGISLNSEGKMGDWLKIGAELRVDEQLVYGLEELLELWKTREGSYIKLDDDRYLNLSEAQQAQLGSLELASSRKAGKWRVPRAALLGLSKHWGEGTELSPSMSELLTQLREQMEHQPTLPRSVRAQLRPYQQEGFEWLATRAAIGLGCCLADEMGLGKTLQVLCLLQARVEHGASLILAPLSLLNNWAQEAAKFTPELRVRVFKPTEKKRRGSKASDYDVLIASYGQLLAKPQDFERDWNLLVLDEAQAIKNTRAQRSRAVAELKAKCRVAMSATPIENHLMELWSLMNILNAGLLGSQRSFKQHGSSASGRQALRELIAPTILRRCKAEVMQELPALTEICIGIELDEAERALYESHRRHALEMLASSDAANSNSITVLSQLTKLRRLCCHGSLVALGFQHSSKLDKLVELARDLREAGHRALIFSQFTDVLQLAQAQLERELQARCLYLDGSLSARERHELVEQFQEAAAEDAAEFFLISLKAGGTGLNLTAADYVILLDPWWNPAIEQQAMGRAHRMGQQKPVTLCRLICHDTVEEKVLAMHQEKQDLAAMLDELPRQDLAALL